MIIINGRPAKMVIMAAKMAILDAQTRLNSFKQLCLVSFPIPSLNTNSPLREI
jgi:hypothetical protein